VAIEAGEVPLNRALNQEFYAVAPWDDGQAEVARYAVEAIVAADLTTQTLVLVTKPETLNAEFYAVADFPFQEKPLRPALRQSSFATLSSPTEPQHVATMLFVDLEAPQNALRLVTTTSSWSGITAKDFLLWEPRAPMRFSSFHDGAGTGERLLNLPDEALLEEQLPVVLRALAFEDGLQVRLTVANPQANDRVAAVQSSPAQARVEKQDGAWAVLLEAQDGRTIRFEFSAEFPYVLQAMDHSDGRRGVLTDVERRAYWMPAP